MRSNLQDNHAQQLKLDSVVLGTTESTLTGDITLTQESPLLNLYDANGSDRIVTLPASLRGRVFIIANIGTANIVTVKDASANTIVIIRAGELQIIVGTSTSWASPPGVFGASGSLHSTGLVPDPGAGEASEAFLREDGLWVIPAGGGGGGVSNAYVHFTDGSTTANASGSDTFKIRSSSGKLTTVVTSNDVTHGDNINLSVVEATVDHDALLNFAANEHIDHTGVSISTAANSGLAGGGTIAATRNLSVDLSNLTADTPVLGDSFAFFDLSGSDTNKATLTTLNSILDHNTLVNYDANRHIDHTGVSIIAGTGMSGGGTIATSRTLNLDISALSVDTIATGDYLAFSDTSGGDHNKISFGNLNASLDYDSFLNLPDLTALENVREKLTTNRNYYVTPSGGGSGSAGSIGDPWGEIQTAINYIVANIDFNSYRITINVADGTAYGGIWLASLTNTGGRAATLYIKGNVSTPANVRLGVNGIEHAAGACYMACRQIGNIEVWLNGMDLRPNEGPCLYADPVNCGEAGWTVGNPDAPDGTIIFSGCGSGQPVVSGNYFDLSLTGSGGCNDVLIAGATLTSPSCLFAVIEDSSVSLLNAFYVVTGSPTVSQGVFSITEGRAKYTFVWHDSISGTVIGPRWFLNESIGPGSSLRVVGGPITNMAGTLPGITWMGKVLTDTAVLEAGKARCLTQFDKTSSTVLANATDLTVDLQTSRRYDIRAEIYTTSNVAGGIKLALAGTAVAADVIIEAIVFNAGAISKQSRVTALGSDIADVTAVTVAKVTITGSLRCTTSGTLTVQFAQNVSNGTASSVLKGSTLTASPAP